MGWVDNKIDHAGDRIERAVEHAADRLQGVVKEGVGQARVELREVLLEASREVDAKLDKISEELSNQRHFTKADVKELVDYAAERLGQTVDERVRVMRGEIAGLVEEKVEYLKGEVDRFFIQRQQDLARERRRLVANILLAVTASLLVAAVSYVYHRAGEGGLDVFGLFRILFASLTGGYAVYLVVNLLIKYFRMTEHRKDLVFLAARYWGVLRPASVLGHLLLLAAIAAVYVLLFFPEALEAVGAGAAARWLRGLGISP
jgi:vacuolar-type H+-ATPase subunit H